MKMTTVMLLGPSLNAVSGVSTHLNQMCRSSLSHDFDLVHFQVGSEGRGESAAGKSLRLLISPFQFAMALFRVRPDIVHVNTSMEQKSYWRDIVYVLIAKLAGRRVLYQVHGGALPEEFFGNRPVLTGLLRRVLRSADAIVLLAQRELLAYRHFDQALPLKVIPNAIDIVADPQDKQLHTRPLLLVYVGRLAESKGVFELLEALALVRSADVKVNLRIAGSGPAEADLRAQVVQMGLQDTVTFLGPVFGEEKDKLWEGADLFGFPTHHEGLPYALLESMAARTPALVCPVGAIPDVMQDGVHGLFVAPQDPEALAQAILRLDKDRDLLQSMGQACRDRIESYYSLERLAQDFRDTYGALRR
ncbi:MAG: glycosyltransferase family 4 protein [Burkholderiales bacterium]|nr:glycosyltransferase family 4 protein [Burkholderiales bacterium]MBH2069625.1 glycosyltransferase family 4 protein [Burkholderiales bacterium]